MSLVGNCYLIIWGLGIGDWAIPNPQSPIPKILLENYIILILLSKYITVY